MCTFAGDVANYYHPLIEQYVRLEHWSNAQNQGWLQRTTCWANKEVYADVPWFWSDQFDLNIQLVGLPRQWDKILFRGNVEAMTFTAFFLKEGRMLAALAVNKAGDIRPSLEIVKAGGNVDSDQLTNESVTMRNLMPPRAQARALYR
jgi:NADPH-dependent 2,4-dienoyl-CoA reductase/sulfur reductase-like enzyme